MAEGDQVGIGGWVSTKHSLAWFAEAYTMEEIRAFWPFLTKDAQKCIACFETLAQLALAMTAQAHHGHSRLSLCLPTESDNDLLASFGVSEPHSLLELRQWGDHSGVPRSGSPQRMGR